ncbi:MAG: branched-chain amino acid ABC transporter permease [Lautropia sp.]
MSGLHNADSLPSSLLVRPAQRFALLRGWAAWSWAALWLAVILAAPLYLDKFWLHVANLALLASMGAIALNLLTGNARLVSLGQAAFLGIGGFTAGLLAEHTSLGFLSVTAIAAVAGAVSGFLAALPSLRLRVLYVAVATLALHFVVTLVLGVIQAQVLNSSGLLLPLAEIAGYVLKQPQQWYFVLLAFTGLFALAALNFLRSYVGRRWVAVADHDVAAETLGISVTGAKVSVFVVTSSMVSVTGAVSAYYVGTVTTEYYSLTLAITYLAMIIVGGMGSVLGSVLGAFLITVLPYLMDKVLAGLGIGLDGGALVGLHSVLFGALIVGFLLFEPRGLAEIWRRIRIWVAQFPYRYASARSGGR